MGDISLGNGQNGGEYTISLINSKFLLIKLKGNITNKTAFDLEYGLRDVLGRLKEIEKIVFMLGETLYLSSKAISLLLNLQREETLMYLDIPESVAERIYDNEILSRFKNRQVTKEAIKEVSDYLNSERKKRGDEDDNE